MKKIKLYFKGDVVSVYDSVEAILMRKSHTIEILVDKEWIIIPPEKYDWFTIL